MPVKRETPIQDYTKISNGLFRNRSLSLKAKGLMSLILSLPENWQFTVKGLAQLSKDGQDSVRSALRELEARGYITRHRERSAQGRLLQANYTIVQNPALEWTDSLPCSDGLSEQKVPLQENPPEVRPSEEMPAQSITNVSITNQLITKLSNPILSTEMGLDEKRKQYRDFLYANLEYDLLKNDRTIDQGQLDSMVELMINALCNPKETVWIAGAARSHADLEQRFSSLSRFHIAYVQECLRNNTVPVKNMPQYLLAALYNAPLTMDSYYQNQVTHDLAEGF